MQDEWVLFNAAVMASGMKPGTFNYYVKKGQIKTKAGQAQRDRLYFLPDVLQLKETKKKPRKYRSPYIIDWMKVDDLPAAIALDLQVYRDEAGELVSEIGDYNLYRSWIKRNPHIAACAFNKENRRDIWAYIALKPLPEPVIWDIVTGKRHENEIKPEEIRLYSEGGAYSLLAVSAVALPGRGVLLKYILEFFMNYFLELYPACSIERIYAEAVTQAGDVLMQKFHFSTLVTLQDGHITPLPGVGMLDLTRPGATRVIQEFQRRLEEKRAR